MQHINLSPVNGKTTSSPGASAQGSIKYPITLEEFYAWPADKYWYKKYSDGWIEQGGYIDAGTLSAYSSIPIFFDPFVSAPVYIECQPHASAAGTGDSGLYGITDISNEGFTFNRGSGTSYTMGFYWLAKGI